MKTSIKIIVLLTVFTMLLAACTTPAATIEAPNSPEESTATEAPVATEAPTTSEEKIELVLWEQSADWRIAAQQSTIDAFEATHPNVTIKIESFPFVEYQTKINTAIQAGTSADIITTVGQWAVPMIEAGVIAEIPEDVLSADTLRADYFAGPADEAIVNGKVYMIPNNTTMGTGGLVYNEDLLVEAGIPVPPVFNTWEEVMEAAQQCTKYDADGNVTQAGYSAHGVIESFLIGAFILQEGQQIIKDGKIAFNNEGGLAALQAYQDIFQKYKVDDPEFIGGIDGFPQGRVCMIDIGAWAGQAAETSNEDIKVGYGDPLPSINPDYPAYSQMDTAWQFIVPESSKNKEMVWEFLKFYITQEQYAARVQYDGELPPLKAAALEFADDPMMDAYVKSAEYSVYSGYKVDREKYNNTVNSYLQLLARGDLSPEAALEGMTTDLNAILAGQ
ncbi:MAG: extracellular solute-binding protein [Smithella sp.]